MLPKHSLSLALIGVVCTALAGFLSWNIAGNTGVDREQTVAHLQAACAQPTNANAVYQCDGRLYQNGRRIHPREPVLMPRVAGAAPIAGTSRPGEAAGDEP